MTDREESDVDMSLRRRSIPGMPGRRVETDERRTATSGGSEDEDIAPDRNAASVMPPSDDRTAEFIDAALKDFSPRWRNWIVRFIIGWAMIFGFFFVIWLGPPALIVLIYIVQIKVFSEIITIGYTVYHSYKLPWFRVLSWYFLFAANYYFYGESIIDHFGLMFQGASIFDPLIRYHRFISFSLYITGFMAFVLTLRKRYYLKQFLLFGWTHMTLLLTVSSAHMLIQNLFEGIIWLVAPLSMVICNDIWAYFFGFAFGRTPLIKLSPKKTWEGFIGGAIATVIFSVGWGFFLLQYKYFICPFEYSAEKGGISYDCVPNPVFRLKQYMLPNFLQDFSGLFFGTPLKYVSIYPFLLHCVVMSLFASLVGPFGGFFASGFKRAFKIKDFASTIPGHGGLLDRVDCQLLNGIFVKVFYTSFVRGYHPQRLLQQIVMLTAEEQLEIYTRLGTMLQAAGALPAIAGV